MEDAQRLVDAVPRYTEAIMGALGSDGSIDHATYERVVVEMGAAGHTGFVLMAWARLLAWSSTPEERPFDCVAGQVDQTIIDHATTLVSVAGQHDDTVLLDCMLRTTDELQSAGVWYLIGCMAWPTKHLFDAVGGYQRFVAIADLISSDNALLANDVAPEQVALPLAALSRGQHDLGRSCLGILAASTSLQHLLGAQLQIGAQILSLSTARMMRLDTDGVPEWIGPLGSEDNTTDARLMNIALSTIAAIQNDDAERASACVSNLRALRDEELVGLTWNLANTLSRSVARQVDGRDDR